MFPKAQALSIFIPEWLQVFLVLKKWPHLMKNVNSMLPQDPAETDTGTTQFPLSSPEKHSGGSQSGAKLVEDKGI